MERPDLNGLDPAVIAYITALEEKVAASESVSSRPSSALPEPSEPPTTMNIITIDQDGAAKRTLRHYYMRQRRGGMGVFDLAGDAEPAFLAAADEDGHLLLFTDQGRVFRVPVSAIPETEPRGRGASILAGFNLRPDEKIAVVVADGGGPFLTLVTARGHVRRIGAQSFGPNLHPGAIIHESNDGDQLAAAAWTSGKGDLFVAAQSGQAIRFSERHVPVRGCLAMRIKPDDRICGVAGVEEADGVFLLGEDGKGTVRLMAGFAANKSPGSGGKTALKCERLTGLFPVSAGSERDAFVLSASSKIIRFAVDEVPPKEGVVQGVNCMNLRNDRCVALTASP
ncbi:MAG: hypothetical protein H6642_15090 [Caldilineaceae bacterium]|nr:hypothetical protein [Caldilineaceae bacterium]